jgi:hypothetical protein
MTAFSNNSIVNRSSLAVSFLAPFVYVYPPFVGCSFPNHLATYFHWKGDLFFYNQLQYFLSEQERNLRLWSSVNLTLFQSHGLTSPRPAVLVDRLTETSLEQGQRRNYRPFACVCCAWTWAVQCSRRIDLFCSLELWMLWTTRIPTSPNCWSSHALNHICWQKFQFQHFALLIFSSVHYTVSTVYGPLPHFFLTKLDILTLRIKVH